MATYNRPSSLPNWCADDPTNCTDPPNALVQSGFTQGSVPVAEYENAYRRGLGSWIGYLDSAATKQTLTSALNLDLRLVGGGNFTYDPATNKLAWDEDLYLAVPGIPLTDNKMAAGAVVLGSGTLAYVTANIPFYTPCDSTSGDAVLRNVTSTTAIAAGQTVSGAGIADGTTVASVGSGTVTLSQAATATASAVSLAFVGTGALVVQSTPISAFTPMGTSVVIAIGQTNTAIIGANSGQMMIRPLEQRRLLSTGFASVVRSPAGQALSAAQACYLSPGTDSRTAGSLYPCDAGATNGATRGRFVGFSSSAAASGAAAHVVSNGIIGGFVGLTIGSTYYLDPANIGAVTATKPATSGQYIVPVGVAVSTTQLQVNPAAACSAVAVAAARQKQVIEFGNVLLVSNGSAYAVQKLATNGQTTKPFIFNYMPDADGSLLGITGTLTPSSTPEIDFSVTQTPPFLNPNNYTSGIVASAAIRGATTSTQQAALFKVNYPAGQIPLYYGCSYSITASSSDATSTNNETLNVRILVDAPA